MAIHNFQLQEDGLSAKEAVRIADSYSGKKPIEAVYDRYDAMERYIARIEAKYTIYMSCDPFGDNPAIDYVINGKRIANFQRYATTGDTSMLPDSIAPIFDAYEAGVPLEDILA